MVAEKIKYRTGTMEKSPDLMTDEELEKWEEKCNKADREYLFSIGQPLVYVYDDKVVIKYADGTIEHRKI